MKAIKHGFIIVVAMLISLGMLAGLCSAADYPRVQIKGTVKYIAAEDTYGILDENGKKYQPVKQLPKEYRKEGTEIVVEARRRPDIVAARMWGTALEVITITRAERFISNEDRQATTLLLRRLDAFNAKDLAILQQVDNMARSLTQDQFDSWLGGYGNFILHYVETVRVEANLITGFCLYSRELQNGIVFSGNTQYALMKFTLRQTGSSWNFADTQVYRPGNGANVDTYIQDLMAKSKIKYGTDNLAKWKG